MRFMLIGLVLLSVAGCSLPRPQASVYTETDVWQHTSKFGGKVEWK